MKVKTILKIFIAVALLYSSSILANKSKIIRINIIEHKKGSAKNKLTPSAIGINYY
jgi:hypothetical protein